MLIKPLNFAKVIQQIAANRLIVGEERRNAYVLWPLAAAQAGAGLVIAVRFMTTIPKTKRSIVGAVIEKVRKVKLPPNHEERGDD